MQNILNVNCTCPHCKGTFPWKKGRGKINVCIACFPLHRKIQELLGSAEKSSKKNKLNFDLDYQWVKERIENKYCPITDLPFQTAPYLRKHPLTPSLDRIDPDKGYTKDNCRIVIWWYNLAKQRHSDITTWHLCKAVVESFSLNSVLSVPKKVEMSLKTT